MTTDLDYREFKPWLLQCLELMRHYEYKPVVTAEEAREAWKKQEDLLDMSRLPRKIAKYVDSIMSWHYMGNAEYEFGSIPKAIKSLFDEEKLVQHEIVVPAKKVPDNWNRNFKYKERKDLPEKSPLTLYYLGPERYVPHLPGFVDSLCKGTLRTKAGHRFDSIADPLDDYDKTYQGWLCLDFPFWMVKNKDLFQKFVDLHIGGK